MSNTDKVKIKTLTRQIMNFIHSDECEDWSGDGAVVIGALFGAMANMMNEAAGGDISPEDAVAACSALFEEFEPGDLIIMEQTT
jgi:hypothetical protein